MRVCVHVSVLLCVICNNVHVHVHVRAHSPAAELRNSAGACACAYTQPIGREFCATLPVHVCACVCL